MKIKELIIKKLYDHYDYDVEFNDDITIIYGLNGSGKTTILNILDAMISGKLLKLNKYNFESIILKYVESDELRAVSLYRGKKSYIEFDGRRETIHWIPEYITPKIKKLYMKEKFYERHDFLKEYSKKFKRIYLPLDRAIDKEEQKNREEVEVFEPFETVSEFKPIEQVAEIIRKKCLDVELKISILNNEYRNKTLREILMNYIRKNNNSNFMEFMESKQKAIDNIRHIKSSYVNFLKTLGLLNEEEEKEFDNIVNFLIKNIKSYKQGKLNMKNIENFLSFTSKLDEFYRLESIVKYADVLEIEKRNYRRPLTLFIQTLNEFFKKGSNDNKEFFINNSELCLKSKYDANISIEQLSSGERQLVILFTYLIFMVNSDDEAIFIVDEPELSLHMLWQRIYIDKIHAVAPNVQIVFATHSPEIISHYSDKLIELVKK